MLNKEELMKKYKDERVLCIKNDVLKKYNDDMSRDYVLSLFEAIADEGYFDYRYNAEIDTSAKQVIPYVVLRHGDKIFVTERIAGDSRLVGQCSIAVGGHINPCDIDGDFKTVDGAETVIANCVIRELGEETTIDFSKTLNISYETTFIDESSDVSRVHVCLLIVADLSDDNVEIKETEKLKGAWIPKDDIDVNKIEGWSKIALDLLNKKEAHQNG